MDSALLPPIPPTYHEVIGESFEHGQPSKKNAGTKDKVAVVVVVVVAMLSFQL